MRVLNKAEITLRQYFGEVEILEFESADEVPVFGSSVGVDTETELITDTVLFPKLVVLGVFDPDNSRCWIAYYDQAVRLMRGLCSQGVEQRYFNLGFDEGVIDNEDPDKSLMQAIDAGHVIDMQIRAHLHEIATDGYIPGNLYSLEGCSLEFLNLQLDKGHDKGDESDRLTFRRGTQITRSQALYLCMDCVSTWALGNAIPPMPTELIHTKGMVVLAHISANGFPVDPVVFNALETDILKDRDEARDRLVSFGFPDPYRKFVNETEEALEAFNSAYVRFAAFANPVTEAPKVNKERLRGIMMQLYNHEGEALEVNECVLDVCRAAEGAKFGKAEKDLYAGFLEVSGDGASNMDAAAKGCVMLTYVAAMLDDASGQIDSKAAYAHGLNIEQMVSAADEALDAHPEWFSTAKPLGPRKFFQQHVVKVLNDNPGLELKRTEKSGEVQLTKTDQWKLEDLGINDKFLDAYIGFNHCQKMLSTYLNRDVIKSDGKVHPRFNSLMRTGRTSCTSPNIQNYPSRGGYPLKNVHRASEGMILCATDFSFVESHRLY